ncbi:MAG TPA: ABC transporter substrate-binding protein [Acidimicrobiales bacterium]|nr:ABC transporter substrate-binding protein [Acidimicrobiales bacterium]
MPDRAFTQAAGASSGPTGSGVGTDDGLSEAGTDDSSEGSGAALGGADTGSTTDAGVATKSGTAAGPASGAAAKANFASDVGVTASSIKIGNITTVGGPMPGQFEPWLLGVRTWLNEVNEKGGINGRKIQLLPCDDGMDSERNKACATDLIEQQKVFALVGTNTPAMPSAKYVNEQKVPAVGVAPIGNYTSIYPYWFSAYGMRACARNGVDDRSDPKYCRGSPRSSNGGLRYYKETVGVSKAAVFWHNIDISKQAGLDTAYFLESGGIDVVYTGETQVAEPDYTGHVLQMKDRGVEGVWDTMEINNNIRLMQAMDRQNWTPKAKISTVAVYGQAISEQVTGPSRNSLYVQAATRPYTDTGNREIAGFIKSFNRYFPGKKKHVWNVDGYRGALLFGDAVTALGANVTRQGMVDWLNNLKDYNPHGLGQNFDFRPYPASFYQSAKPPPSCSAFAQFKNDDFYNTPGDAFKCFQGDWVDPRPE